MKTPWIQAFVCQADYAQPAHARALVELLDSYARDPMGGGEPLSDFTKAHIEKLSKRFNVSPALFFEG